MRTAGGTECDGERHDERARDGEQCHYIPMDRSQKIGRGRYSIEYISIYIRCRFVYRGLCDGTDALA